VTTRRRIRELRAEGIGDNAMVFTPDGRSLLTGGTGQPLRLWEVATGRERARLGPALGGYDSWQCSPDGRTIAVPQIRSVRLLDAATGGRLADLEMGLVNAMAFSADGRRLATGSSDGVVIVWDVADITGRKGPGPVELSARERDALWADLVGDDSAKAYRALNRLAAAPDQAVPLVGEALGPVRVPDGEQLARLVGRLDAEKFADREGAARDLERWGEAAGPALRAALAKGPTPELRRRVQGLLDRLDRERVGPAAGDRLRDLRAVELLERVGTAAAKRALEEIAGGAGPAREAKAALDRLGKRNGVDD
jgi:hypothetical protein